MSPANSPVSLMKRPHTAPTGACIHTGILTLCEFVSPETRQCAPRQTNENRHTTATNPQQTHPDDTQDEEPALLRLHEERQRQMLGSARASQNMGTPFNPFIEDDEDLFRLDSSEFISGIQQSDANDDPNSQLDRPKHASESSDTIDSRRLRNNNYPDDLLTASQPVAPREPLQQHEAYLDQILDNSADVTRVPGDALGHARESLSWPPMIAGEAPSGEPQERRQRTQSVDRAGDKKIDDHTASSVQQNRHRDHWNNQPGQRRSPAPLDHVVRDHTSSSADTGSDDDSDSGGHQRGAPPSLSAVPENELGPFSSRSKLAKFVQRIAPEPSCYTGLGEHYRGNASMSLDQRPCLNWLQVFTSLQARQNVASNQSTPAASASVAAGKSLSPPSAPRLADNHNHCRNPNADQRGPWCFVAYSSELDGPLVIQPYTSGHSSQQWKTATSKRRTVRISLETGQLFVVAPCHLASCSEYLWLYLVAPPLGLIILLTCLISFTIKSIRKSHYNSILTATYQRHNSLESDSLTKSKGLFYRLLGSRRRSSINAPAIGDSPSKRKVPPSNKLGLFRRSWSLRSPSKIKRDHARPGKCRGKYPDDDTFEVVDDIDWSDGQPTCTTSQSISPSESFKMHSTTTSTSNDQRAECNRLNWRPIGSTLRHSKSTNPMYNGGQQVAALDLHSGRELQDETTSTRMSKSKSQVGPMFATLRWHVRNVHQQNQKRRCQEDVQDYLQSATKKSSSFIENGSLGVDSNQRVSPKLDKLNSDQTSASITSNLSSLRSSKTTEHLISCSPGASGDSSSSSSSSNAPTRGSLGHRTGGGSLLASELPKLDASGITLAYDVQPIYEGKFSQVQVAYMKQRSDDLAQATGKIGAQVAVCSLKQQAAIDDRVFYPNELRLCNLNHLNIIKLLGYVELDNSDKLDGCDYKKSNQSTTIRTNAKCSLVYDMAHMIDLNDWLREQSKDAFDALSDCDLGLRQNLTCLAKQIALAIDYLHDKNIIFKDLACRNCFLDVTRMLVKLASFNIEPEFDTSDKCRSTIYSGATGEYDDDSMSKKLSLKSMVRPKYLLDYYVIDSRPVECQLLPLSWLSLESILFNKFNKHTDIWSFGCLLYELFSLGEVAYFGYSSKQVIDSVRSNLMPPQPMLCPNGIYKLMCKCLSDIPTLRPTIKHVYEQLNLYSGQCSSFLNHHLCII